METMLLVLAATFAVLVLAGAAFALNRLRAAERRADRAARQAEALGRCLGMIARELEAPGLSLLGLAARLPPAVAPDVETEARRLLNLAEEVADHFLSQPGSRGLAENRIPLGPLLHETVGAVSRLMGDGARHWHVTPEAEALVLLADRRALRRALSQSLARAARETRSGDRIALRVVRAAETVALVIEDEGAGLPRDDLSGLGEGTRGLSLGLAAARELMRAHGGELTLEATPGIGARTWLTLPRGRVLEDPVAA